MDAVREKTITYTDDFKRQFIAGNEKGKSLKEVFKQAVLDVEPIGHDRVRCAAKRWRATYSEHGVEILQDT